jgi:hypothetical protein
MVREALLAERMLAVVSREGPLKRVTGLAGGYLQTG